MRVIGVGGETSLDGCRIVAERQGAATFLYVVREGASPKKLTLPFFKHHLDGERAVERINAFFDIPQESGSVQYLRPCRGI